MERFGVEGVVWLIGLGSTGHRQTLRASQHSRYNSCWPPEQRFWFQLFIDGMLESSDGSDESIDLYYLARPLTATEAT
jgi:hypothetical protein